MVVIPLPAWPLWIGAVLLAIALAIRGAIPRGHRRRVRGKVLLRALLPARIVRSRSARLDISAYLFARFLAAAAIGWALVSGTWWATLAERATVSLPGLPVAVPALPAACAMTLALFLAYEGAYWLNHWLSHRLPWLWAFHKVHHTAESLSPLTNFRVHPVDTIVFYNMAAAITGLTAGLLQHLLGPRTALFAVDGGNVAVFLTLIVVNDLQHSHLWLSATGRWGRWLLSPAHHQLHHSIDPAHHHRNFGSTLALFDRLAGTLAIPSAKRQSLCFGVAGLAHDPHGLRGALVQPFVEAAEAIARPIAGSARA